MSIGRILGGIGKAVAATLIQAAAEAAVKRVTRPRKRREPKNRSQSGDINSGEPAAN